MPASLLKSVESILKLIRYFGSRSAHCKIQNNFTVMYVQKFMRVIKAEHFSALTAAW